MYRQRIQENYIHLSPSYRKVADFVMGHYYEMAFMTAAQLASAVDVDTTTVVRFSQRLGYGGYPDLLQDVRAQVKEELHAVHEPASLSDNDPAAIFKSHIDQASANLRQTLVHNSPNRLRALAVGIGSAERVLFVGQGALLPAAQMAASHLYLRGLWAEAVGGDPAQQALSLAGLTPQDAVVGLSDGGDARSIARCLAYARQQGCRTFAVVGRLDGALVRWADEILYVPVEETDPPTALAAFTCALLALAQTVMPGAAVDTPRARQEASQNAYRFLTDGTAPAG